MTQTIVVQTGARLHFGFLSCKSATGRQFGGAGVMIDSPGFEVAVREAGQFRYLGPSIWRGRVEKIISTISPNKREPSFEIEIRREIPPHIGLGSGTQLSMSLAAAVSEFCGERAVNSEILASRVSRGARSALGIHGFARGGFLHDAGKLEHENVGQFADRIEFPSEWKFVLITPPVESGLAGRQELEAFARLPPMPIQTTERLQQLLTLDMIPALSERLFLSFAESLFEFGRIVGDYFAPVQGGTFASPMMAELIGHLRNQGVHGVGQTSWGPTIFALYETAGHAEQMARDIESDARWSECQIRIVSARNRGADVIVKTL